MEPIHIICIFELFCRMGEPCEAEARTLVNLRYQPEQLFAEFWIGAEPQIPSPAVLSTPGPQASFNHLSFFVSGDLSYTHLITLDPESLAATWTTHLPYAEGLPPGQLQAVSSQTICQPAGAL